MRECPLTKKVPGPKSLGEQLSTAMWRGRVRMGKDEGQEALSSLQGYPEQRAALEVCQGKHETSLPAQGGSADHLMP